MTPPQDGLTARQVEILRLAADGLHPGEIAAQCGISRATVRKQLAAARRRTGADTTSAAVAVARERGWLSA